MLSILHLKAGDRAMVLELPKDLAAKQSLLVHGLHIGGKIRLIQLYKTQELALIMQNGRKIALRTKDCESIKVVKVDE